MLTYLLLAVLATGGKPPVVAHHDSLTPRVVQCTARNTPEGKDRRCRVRVPAGSAIRRCDSRDRAAGHCTLHKKGELVAWAVGTNGAVCRLSKKKTDWKSRVAVKVNKATPPGAGSCHLYVAIQ